MVNDLLPAEPGTLALEVQYDGDSRFTVIEHPIVGFAHVSGEMVHPLTVANCTNVRAVAFADGRVTDRRLRESFPSRAKWADAVANAIEHEGRASVVDVTPKVDTGPEGNEPGSGTTIDGLVISTRAKNALKNSLGVTYVRDLANHKAALVRNTKGVPSSAMAELREAMTREGVAFADEEPGKGHPEPEQSDNDDLL